MKVHTVQKVMKARELVAQGNTKSSACTEAGIADSVYGYYAKKTNEELQAVLSGNPKIAFTTLPAKAKVTTPKPIKYYPVVFLSQQEIQRVRELF